MSENEIGDGIWTIFNRDIFFGYFCENDFSID